MAASFYPARCDIAIQDGDAKTRHTLANKRYNYQSMDSPVDLLAMCKFRSRWRDRFTGTVYLAFPRITGVPRELFVRVICSWVLHLAW